MGKERNGVRFYTIFGKKKHRLMDKENEVCTYGRVCPVIKNKIMSFAREWR